MGNIIDNQLRVEGPRETLEMFKSSFALFNDAGEIENVELGILFPIPELIKELAEKDAFNKIANNWKRKMWGLTTWCVVDESANYTPYSRESDSLDIYEFTSNWIEPLSFFINASEVFNTIKFSLSSCDLVNDCARIYEISNGEITSSKSESGIED